MATLAVDSFLRATSTGWGNTSDGQTWTLVSGAGTYAIGTGAYTISGSSTTYGDGGTLTATNALSVQYCGVKTTADFEQLVRVKIVNNVGSSIGLLGRGNGAGNTYYRCRLKSGNLDVLSVLNGTGTTIGTAAFTVTLGSYYWIRFRVTGSTLKAKVWLADGTLEPTAWNVTIASDTSIVGAGRFGIVSNPFNTSEICTYDSYSCTDGTAPSSISTDSPYGFTFFVNGSVPGGGSPPTNTPAQLFSDLVNLAQGGKIWLRHQFAWRRLEQNPGSIMVDPPSNSPIYNASALAVLDDTVSQCNSNGINLLLTLQDCPDNYQITDGGGVAAIPITISTTLNQASLTTSATSFAVASGASFPASSFVVKIDSEIILVGTNATNTFSGCTRAYQGTTAATHTNGATIAGTGQIATASAYQRFARFIVDRYNGFTGHGTAQAFQDGNEEFDTYSPRTSNALVPVVNRCYPMIKALYPGVSVGQCAVRKTPTSAQTHITNWCTNLFSNIGTNSDWCDFHYYRDGTCTPDPNVSCTDSSATPSVSTEITLISNALAGTALAGNPIYVLETGWTVGNIVNDPSMKTSTLGANITNTTQLSFTIGSNSGFPTGSFIVLIDNEWILCDSRSGTTCTVNVAGRGYGGSTASTHNAGVGVSLQTTLTEALQSQYIREMYDAGRTSTNLQAKKVFVWTIDYSASGNAAYGNNVAYIPTTYRQAFNDIRTYIGNYPQWTPAPPPSSSGATATTSARSGLGITTVGRDGFNVITKTRDGTVTTSGRDGTGIITSGRDGTGMTTKARG